MNINEVHKVYFLGIGGIGMSALARWFKAHGTSVAGYDKTPSPLIDELEKEGIDVHFDDDIQKIPADADLVVYTPAIPKDHQEYNYLQKQDIPMLKRSQVLGEISRKYPTIAIAGTHGKTTVTSMVAHILKASDVQLSAFIGGIANNFNSNLVLSDTTDVVVVEADEFDRSFLTLHPDIAVVTSMDADHLDIYGSKDYLTESFFLFTQQIRKEGHLILAEGLPVSETYSQSLQRYSAVQDSAYQVSKLHYQDGKLCFDIQGEGEYHEGFSMEMPGRHNAENALAACLACVQYGLSWEQVKQALASYRGVKRRFDIRSHKANLVYIDDYAHHPKELESTIQATREMFPGKKVCGIFQPHLFSRTRDFADDFARSLELLDELALMEIYPARELPIEGITSSFLLDKVRLEAKSILQKADVESYVEACKADIILTLGAGDIDRHIESIENIVNRS